MQECWICVYKRPDGTMFQGQPHRSIEYASLCAQYAYHTGNNIIQYAVHVKLKGKNPNHINLFRQ